ncbi:hypothetical protein Tco_1053544, partial [Tanacetum coccineum]
GEGDAIAEEDEVVPRVEDVSLVDGVFDGALGGDKDEDFAIGERRKKKKKKKRNVMKNQEVVDYFGKALL